ncbi:hypothetical protein HRbin06_00155 [archaeon HR06]|nr:hypothetical protein HRbin06_00155 [archaeon HR06]
MAGEKALEYIRERDRKIENISKLLQSSPDKIEETIMNFISNLEKFRRVNKTLLKNFGKAIAKEIIEKSIIVDDIKLCVLFEELLDEASLIAIGEKSIEMEDKLVFIGITTEDDKLKLVTFSSDGAIRKGINAGILAKKISEKLGGSGGGNQRFGRGGGYKEKFNKKNLKEIISLVMGS